MAACIAAAADAANAVPSRQAAAHPCDGRARRFVSQRRRLRPLLLLLLLAAAASSAFWQGCEAKIMRSTVRLGLKSRSKKKVTRHKWQFVGKYGYDIGAGWFSIRIRERYPKTLNNFSFTLEVYLDEEWPMVEQMENVCDRSKHARRLRDVNTGFEGGWGEEVNGTLRQKVRPHVWYFVISDCKKQVEQHDIEVELITRQENGSEFSVEMRWALLANITITLGFTVFMLIFWKRSRDFQQKTGNLHPVIWALAAVVTIQYAAQVFHTLHLILYRSNGTGLAAMEVSAEIFMIISEIIETSLLIIIGSGYTLTRGKLGDLDFVPFILFIVALGECLIAFADKMQPEAAHVFTQYEGIKGWLFLIMRAMLYTWFLIAAYWTAQAAGLRVKSFVVQFSLAGSVYFLAYPVTFFVAHLFAPYWRKPVMETGMMLAQVLSNLWLSTLFLSRGAYFEVSSLSASPLPGAGSPSRFFKAE